MCPQARKNISKPNIVVYCGRDVFTLIKCVSNIKVEGKSQALLLPTFCYGRYVTSVTKI